MTRGVWAWILVSSTIPNAATYSAEDDQPDHITLFDLAVDPRRNREERISSMTKPLGRGAIPPCLRGRRV